MLVKVIQVLTVDKRWAWRRRAASRELVIGLLGEWRRRESRSVIVVGGEMVLSIDSGIGRGDGVEDGVEDGGGEVTITMRSCAILYQSPPI